MMKLGDNKDFCYVTLACEDEQNQAHKVILSAYSPFFRNILCCNPHQYPPLYLKGVKLTDPQVFLTSSRRGQELNFFLAVAEDLKVKGLTQNQSGGAPNTNNRNESSLNSSTPARPCPYSSSAQSCPLMRQLVADDIQEVILFL